MLLTKETTIYTLTQEYPVLIDALATHNTAFEKLKNTLLRQTMGRVSTIEKAAAMGNERVLDLMLFIAGKVKDHRQSRWLERLGAAQSGICN
nr:DUF1858 domain-containing protein [uncultured Desulfobulbus sp.]